MRPMSSKEAAEIRRRAAILKILGHPVRLQILSLLQKHKSSSNIKGEVCVSRLIELLGSSISQPAVSQHIARMSRSKILLRRRSGRNIFISYDIDTKITPHIWIGDLV